MLFSMTSRHFTAARYGHAGVAKVLLQNGANVNAVQKIINSTSVGSFMTHPLTLQLLSFGVRLTMKLSRSKGRNWKSNRQFNNGNQVLCPTRRDISCGISPFPSQSSTVQLPSQATRSFIATVFSWDQDCHLGEVQFGEGSRYE